MRPGSGKGGKKARAHHETAGRHLAHTVYFRLADTSEEVTRRFLDACKRHLSRHDGQIRFSVSRRAVTIRRDVSALDFDVAMDMVFRDFRSYRAYAKSGRHEAFITDTAGMCLDRVVYDSFIEPGDLEPRCR